MGNITAFIRKWSYKIFTTRLAGILILVFAAAIGIATFIENDFGTSAAQKVIFKARWFELLLLLFSLSILVNVFRFRMIQQKKWAVLTFHLSILVILLGAAVTRYFGYEGIMHIREDATTNQFISSETYIQVEAKQGDRIYQVDEKVLFAALGRNRFNETYQFGPDVVNVKLKGVIPNPENILETDEAGVPILKVVIGGNAGREEYFLRQGDFKPIRGTWFNFGNPEQPQAINIYYRDKNLVFQSPRPLMQMQMATQQRDSIPAGTYQTLLVRALYSNDQINFVIGDFNPQAKMIMRSTEPKIKNESIVALHMGISGNGQEQDVFIYGNKGMEGQPEKVIIGNTEVAVSYGAKKMSLPFSLKLRDFIMERYPGTNSASSYASEVTLIDPRKGLREDHRIYMNNILNYGGFRFFQSSFDQDELGTVLSVNHDFWGTWISYIGYALLTLGMILTLFTKSSRFQELSRKLKSMRVAEKTSTVATTLLLLIMASPVLADNVDVGPRHIIPESHAEQFGRLLVQDHKGRMKPMNTLSSEVLRKVSRKETLFGMSPDQIFLGMTLFPEEWAKLPMIKIGDNEQIRSMIPASGELAAFDEFFTAGGQYIIKEQVRRAYSLQPIDRTALDKEIMKIDERVNILNMIFNGSMARLFPDPGHPNDLWLTPADAVRLEEKVNMNQQFVAGFFASYATAVHQATSSQNWSDAQMLVTKLHDFQQTNGGDVLISDSKVNMEITLNKLNVFSRLGKWYGLLGLLFLISFFIKIFNPKIDFKWPTRIGFFLLLGLFLFHILGLGIRWYVSGRAPWSNGYESMIYIAFTTVLAGLIFSRKSLGGLTATSILASTILMVAGLSWLDPEITPLVPVLRSYWLTIHVSLIAGSYGFLMLGAIIGLLNLLSMIFLTENNKERIFRTVSELTHVSEMTLIGGLFMISIGTYLGGVWANESWGRYWGWDAKETWALVTILVYAFILHMRFIPGLRGLFAFNFASLFGFASVMMTYFGVNYYLSGLHSYAAGDPVPIPPSVYYTATFFTVVSLLGYWRHSKLKTKK